MQNRIRYSMSLTALALIIILCNWNNFTSECQHKKVKIAVIDTGIEERLILKCNIIGFYDIVNRQHRYYDDNGHGTSVINTIINNKYNVQSITCKTQFIVIKAADAEGNMTLKNLETALKIAKQQDADIINISIGGIVHSKIAQKRIQRMILNLNGAGITVIAAAGDEKKEVLFPANLTPECICVFSDQARFGQNQKDEYKTSCSYPAIKSVDFPNGELWECGTSFSTAIATSQVANMKSAFKRIRFSNEEICMFLKRLHKGLA